MKIKIGLSNRHVHLTNEDVEILFGKGYKLTPRNYLYQPGQFATEETVTLKTNKNIKEHVRIVGPTRSYTQVEVLEEDKEYFGINPPVRNSKDLENSESMTIIGPKGHIHINTRDKGKLKEDDIVTVEVNSTILDNVHIKIDDSFKTELHINKDDAIKHNITNESVAILKED